MELDNRLQKTTADASKQQEEARKAIAAAAAQSAAAAAAGSLPSGAAAAGAAAAVAAQQQQDAAAPLANGGPPGAAAAAGVDGNVLNNMRKAMAQAPGYARMVQESFMGATQAAAAAAANAMGGPEHVPQPAAARSSMSGMQETDLERKTRELQVRVCAAVDVLGGGGPARLGFGGVRGLSVTLHTSASFTHAHAPVLPTPPRHHRRSSSSSSRSAASRRRRSCWPAWRGPWASTRCVC
jgi:hypothetical protein